MGAESFTAAGADEFACVSGPARERIAKIKLLILDVDGVLTDGGLYYAEDGSVTKRFNVHDGSGIALARRSGIHVAVITGHDKPAVAARMRDLRVDDYFPGLTDKRESYEIIRQRYGLEPEEVAYLGDDWIDLPVMGLVGAPLAVANAQPEVAARAVYVTKRRGGDGAVRETIRLILFCRGELDRAFAAWMERFTS